MCSYNKYIFEYFLVVSIKGAPSWEGAIGTGRRVDHYFLFINSSPSLERKDPCDVGESSASRNLSNNILLLCFYTLDSEASGWESARDGVVSDAPRFTGSHSHFYNSWRHNNRTKLIEC